MNNSSPTIADTLAGFVTELDCASIPAAIHAQAKLHLLDSVGVALASASFEFAHKACAGLAALGSGEYTVIGMNDRKINSGVIPVRRADGPGTRVDHVPDCV